MARPKPSRYLERGRTRVRRSYIPHPRSTNLSTMSTSRTHAAPSVARRVPSRTVTFDPDNPAQAIRKKIESELARKRTISTTQHQSRKRGGKTTAQKGTVAALKPSPALTVPEDITVSEASQLCAAKRTDCVLVVDDDEGLSGIFTAKDLAYRVRGFAYSPASEGVIDVADYGGRFGPARHPR